MKLTSSIPPLLALWIAAVCTAATAQTDKGPPRIRHVYIPQTELEAIFGEGNKGTLLTRDEFQELWDKAQRSKEPAGVPPADAVITHAHYEARIEEHALRITARLRLHKLDDTWQTVELPFAAVAIRSATLDGEPARLGRDRTGSLVWVVREAGRFELLLELSAPLTRTGGDLTAWFHLPRFPGSELVLHASADKQVRANGLEVHPDDPEGDPQTFRVPLHASGQVMLALLDRSAEADRRPLVFANSEWNAAVEPAGVRWHSDVRLDVSARAAASFEFTMPAVLEVASVEAPDLATWKLQSNNGSSTLHLNFHQPVLGSRTVRVSGLLPIALGEPWNMPAITVRNAVSQVGEIKISVSDALHVQPRELSHVRRLPWETSESKGAETQTRPPAAAGTRLRYAYWSDQFQLELRAETRQRALAVAAATLVDVERHGLTLRSSVTLEPRYAPLFDVTLELPADWTITSVLAGDQRVPWDRTSHRVEPRPVAAAGDRAAAANADAPRGAVQYVRLDLPQPLTPGNTTTLLVVADHRPAGWLEAAGTATSIPIPRFRVLGADEVEGSLTIEAPGELDVNVVDLSQDLEPAPPAAVTGGATSAPGADTAPATVLNYRYQDDADLSGRIEARVRPAQVSVETLAMASFGRETLAVYYQVEIQVAAGLERRFEFTLPASAGEKVHIAPLQEDVRVIEQQHTADPNSKDTILWRIVLDRPVSDKLLLAVTFEQPHGGMAAERRPTELAILAFRQVARQTGYIAVEAAADQEVHSDAKHLRDVDPADLPAWVAHQPGRIVAAYHYQRLPYTLTLAGTERDAQEVLAGVCDHGTITTIVSRHGVLRHEATYQVRSRGVQHFAMQLPREAHLWAVMLNGSPIEARRTDDKVIVPLPAAPANSEEPHHRVAVVYETVSADADAAFAGLLPRTIRQHAPSINMTTLQLDWTVHLPDGTALVSTAGDFRPSVEPTRPSFVAALRDTIALESTSDLGTKSLWLLAALAAAGAVWVVAQLSALPPRVMLWSGIAGGAAIALCVLVLWPGRVAYREAARAAPSSSMRFLAPDQTESEYMMEGRKSEMAPGNEMAPSESEDAAAPMDSLRSDFGGEMAAAEPSAGGYATTLPAASPAPARANQLIGVAGRLARLSLAVSLGSPSTPGVHFTRRGETGEELVVRVQDDGSAHVLLWLAATLIVALAWLLRNRSIALRAAWAGLCLLLPLGLSGLLPLAWTLLLDGIFFGGLGSIVLWCICSLVRLFSTVMAWSPTTGAAVRSAGAALLLVCVLGGGEAGAQNPKRKTPAPPPAKIVTNAAAVAAAAAAPESADPAATTAPKPFTLYVPYDPEHGDPRDSRWVYIPYDQFQRLWMQAHPDQATKRPPGVTALVAEARYDGRGDGDVARFQGRIVVHAYEEKWNRVALPLGGVAIERIEVNGRPAAVDERSTATPDDRAATPPRLQVYLPEPGVHVVDVAFSVPLSRLGQTGRFTVPLELTAAGRLRFELPGPGLDVQVEGSGGGWRRSKQGNAEFVDLPVGGPGPVTVAWQPRTEAARATQLVSVDQTLYVDILDSGVHLHSQFQYSIAQGAVRVLEFSVPPGLAVRSVKGGDVADWSVHDQEPAAADDRAGQSSKLAVTLKADARARVDVEIESFVLGQAPVGSVPIQSLVPLGVTRETGRMAIGCSAQFLVRVAESGGLAQIERELITAAERPDSSCELLAAYRYTGRPWTMALEVSRIQPRLKAASSTGVAASGDRVRVHASIEVTISDAPTGLLELELPAGLRLNRVITPAGSDWFVKPGPDATRLAVELDEPRVGVVGIEIIATRTREANEDRFVVPRVSLRGAAAETGQIAVVLDEDLEGQELERAGARSIRPGDLRGILQPLAGSPRVFAYEFSAAPAGLSLRLRAAASRLSCDVVSTVSVRDGSVAYVSELLFEVRGAPRPALEFDTPAWLGDDLQVRAEGVRQIESRMDGDRRVWTVTFQSPVRGRVQMHLLQMLPIPQDGRIDAAVPRPGDAEPVRSYIIVENRSAAELSDVERRGVSDQPLSDLPAGVTDELRQRAIAAYKVTDPDARLAWRRQEREQVKALAATINLADLITVISRDGSYRTQAAYVVNNRTQQFLELALPTNSRLWSVTVAGEPVRPASGDRAGRRVTLVPLEKISVGDFAAQVVVIYSGTLGTELGTWTRFAPQAPDILGDIPVARTLWTVYTPDDYSTRFVEQNSNMTQVASGDHVIARDLAVLEEVNELLSVAKFSSSSSAHVLACYNLKQINTALGAFQKAPLERAAAAPQLNNLQSWRAPQSRTSVSAQLELFCCPSDIGQVRGDQTWALVQQRASELKRQVDQLAPIDPAARDEAESGLAVDDYFMGRRYDREDPATHGGLKALDDQLADMRKHAEVDEKELRRGKLREQNMANFERVKEEQVQTRALSTLQAGLQPAAPTGEDRPQRAGDPRVESIAPGTHEFEQALATSRPGVQSIDISIPLVGQPHHFMTLVDQPKLALSARHHDMTHWTAGSAWAILCVGIAAVLLRALAAPATYNRAVRRWPWLALAAGLAWLYLLPFGPAGVALIVLALGTLAWRTRSPRAATA